MAKSRNRQGKSREGVSADQATSQAYSAAYEAVAAPRSVEIAAEGITTSRDLCGLLAAIIEDTMTEAISHRVANASINAVGKLLKVYDQETNRGVQRRRVIRYVD